jgi:sialate O-acetylesterase
MIHPLAPFAMRGAIWYQGESNGSDEAIYLNKLQALIGGWRSKWNQGDFPFYIVQISNFSKVSDDGKTWSKVREAQMNALASITNTGLAVTIDIGETKDIHPKNKQDVGRRLALWALAGPYGKDIDPSGPLYKGFSVEASKIRISFEHAKDGLMIGRKDGLTAVVPEVEGKIKWLEISGADQRFKRADAVIEGSELVVSSPEVTSPVAVRYAFKQDPAGANLYDNEGLPASPFRTDSW